MRKLLRLAPLGVALFTTVPMPAVARVVSYAPLTARPAIPAVQSRLDRRFLLIERTGFTPGPPIGGPACYGCYSYSSRLVLYDSAGIDEPRDVSPGGKPSYVFFAASFEEGGVVHFLIASDAALAAEAPQQAPRLLYSRDSGVTWTVVALPDLVRPDSVPRGAEADVGGWIVHERGSNLRLGTSEVPFIAAFPRGTDGGWGLVSVDASGHTRLLATGQGGSYASALIGTNPEGNRVLFVADAVQLGPGGAASGDLTRTGLFSVDLSGGVTRLLSLGGLPTSLSGWTAADGSTYLQYNAGGALVTPPFSAPRSVGVVKNGTFTELVTADSLDTTRLFAVPSAYWRGAWILKRDSGPTVLLSHGPTQGLKTHWSDVTRPEVEAVHVGVAGTRLLVQVHRPRITPARRFVDPALAVWDIGQPAPKGYDELFLNEVSTKGFVHLDVDAVASGSPFVFDSGSFESMISVPGGPSGGGGGGGADVVQEWGVVRGALRQQLVIPASARVSGLFESTWRTDLILRNPDDTPLPLTVQLLSNPQTTDSSPGMNLVLSPKEIRLVPDVLNTLFELEKGSGALLLVPGEGRSIDATSRTFSASTLGTFGMGVGAVDLFASASPNFPVTFSAGLLGPNFRTNAVLTDASGRGSKLSLSISPASADLLPVSLALDAPRGGQRQLSGLGDAAGFPAGSRGSVRLAPTTGQVIGGLIAIDNLTNDPTWFTPDLPATVARTIPAIVHADGSGGAAYRSDLFLFNPTSTVRWIYLTARDWQSPRNVQSFSLTLLPQESKVIKDALKTAFGMTGVAQVAFSSDSSTTTNEGVRATSRTYTIGTDGGTYGHPVPPLNSFQSVTGGETLEILGPVAAPSFRTNLSLVDLQEPGQVQTPVQIRVEIVDSAGRTTDSFTTPLAPGGGVQLNDLFRARGLREDLGPVLIRVSPSSGNVAAYATTIDNGTNDPTYFQAVLAASAD